jgi:methyl-accepting chemotaxis protein
LLCLELQMFVIDNLGLKLKLTIPFCAIMAIFAAVLAGAVFQLVQQGKGSAQIIEHADRALALLSQEDLDVQGLGYGVYRILSYQTGTDAEARAVADFQAKAANAATLLDQAAAVYPAQADGIRAFKPRLAAIMAELETQNQVAVTTNGFTLGTKDTPADIDVSAGVARDMVGIDAQIDRFSNDLTQFTTQVRARNIAATQALRDRTQTGILAMIGIGLAAMGGGITGFLWIITAGVVRPLLGVGHSMTRLASGALDTLVDGQKRRDEVGQMARAVLVFKENAIKARTVEEAAAAARAAAAAERSRQEQARAAQSREQQFVVSQLAAGLAKLSDGDLLIRLSSPFSEAYEKLRGDFNAAMDRLQETMRTIAESTQNVSSGTEGMRAASDDLARRTEQQAANLQETAAALDQITAAVRKTAENSDGAREAVASAKNDAETSGAVMRDAVSAMGGVEQSTREIANILGMIDEIAFQTNLLALNAGVEAARAGDSGRGFAVVATEVRALAQRSADAAKEIKALIVNSNAQVSTGVRLVGETGEALLRIATQVATLNNLIGDIAASAREQSSGLQQVNTAVNQMDQVTQQNAAMVEQATAASRELLGESQELARLVGRFQIGRVTAAVTAPARRAAAPALQMAAPGKWSAFSVTDS